jgi:LuxR family transcriptional regulator
MMGVETDILESLTRLDRLCTAGYAIALHIHFTTPRFLFQTYQRNWMKYYSEKGLVLKDPTVAWGFQNVGIARWSDLSENDPDGVLEKAWAYGLKFGVTYATDQGGSRTISSFARDDRENTAAEVDELSEIVLGLHDYTSGLEAISAAAAAKLKEMSVAYTHV